jgi:beta-galactosidase
MEPFKANSRKAFHGLCLAIVQCGKRAGPVALTATADGLNTTTIFLKAVK